MREHITPTGMKLLGIEMDLMKEILRCNVQSYRKEQTRGGVADWRRFVETQNKKKKKKKKRKKKKNPDSVTVANKNNIESRTKERVHFSSRIASFKPPSCRSSSLVDRPRRRPGRIFNEQRSTVRALVHVTKARGTLTLLADDVPRGNREFFPRVRRNRKGAESTVRKKKKKKKKNVRTTFTKNHKDGIDRLENRAQGSSSCLLIGTPQAEEDVLSVTVRAFAPLDREQNSTRMQIL
ncbi:hypothetical protein PUN28_010780 [Cardiocondyla obscurior]|uniref:Uncharacterized protein n=1 Tax=Cardiocondyla obscurior TaxID=286306 RepID=A0AAW2FMX4_9HYME